HLGNWVLVRYAAFSRWRSQHPPFSEGTFERYEPKTYEGKFSVRICKSKTIEYFEVRGARVDRPSKSKSEVLTGSFGDEEQPEKRYAEFIIHDWKNQQILRDYSIAPSNFANYFTKSDLPFETSPIFFKAEVLDKYKGNPDKYTLKSRTIECR